MPVYGPGQGRSVPGPSKGPARAGGGYGVTKPPAVLGRGGIGGGGISVGEPPWVRNPPGYNQPLFDYGNVSNLPTREIFPNIPGGPSMRILDTSGPSLYGTPNPSPGNMETMPRIRPGGPTRPGIIPSPGNMETMPRVGPGGPNPIGGIKTTPAPAPVQPGTKIGSGPITGPRVGIPTGEGPGKGGTKIGFGPGTGPKIQIPPGELPPARLPRGTRRARGRGGNIYPKYTRRTTLGGPFYGPSVTPEMIRRAAIQRLG